MNVKKNNISDSNEFKKKHHFEANKNYFVISIYTLSVIILSIFFIFFLWNFKTISNIVIDFFNKASSFIIAFFIAYFLNPIVKFFYSRFFSKSIKSEKKAILISIIIAYVIVLTCIALLLIVIVPKVYYSLADLTETISTNLPAFSEKCINFIEGLEKRFPWLDWNSIEKEIKTSMPHFMELTTNLVSYVFTKAINISISVVSTVLTLMISFMVSIYMILDKKILAHNSCRLAYAIFSKERTIDLCKTIRECNNIFYNFVMGKAVDSTIIGIITFISMSILKLDFILLISLIVGVTNMIPYFGPFIGAIPSIIILLIIDPIDALIFTVLIFVIQQFDGMYLGPKILGGSCGIKPLWVIFGITIGGAYGGAFGMFLGVPFTAIIAHLINKFISGRLLKKNITAADFKKVGL